jgi:hypothetical protein
MVLRGGPLLYIIFCLTARPVINSLPSRVSAFTPCHIGAESKNCRDPTRPENVMSNLSFARIMYGATQEGPSPALIPVSNVPSHLRDSSQSSLALAASHATIESLLHRALLVLSHKH